MPKGSTLWRHNISDAEYDALWNEQGGRCAVCLRETKLVIDHDHECCPPSSGFVRTCGRCIRGLLCYRCNGMLGYLDGSPPDVIVRAIIYIHGKNRRGVGQPFGGIDLVGSITSYLHENGLANIA